MGDLLNKVNFLTNKLTFYIKYNLRLIPTLYKKIIHIGQKCHPMWVNGVHHCPDSVSLELPVIGLSSWGLGGQNQNQWLPDKLKQCRSPVTSAISHLCLIHPTLQWWIHKSKDKLHKIRSIFSLINGFRSIK